MKGHLKLTDIIRYINGTSGRSASEAEIHLSRCKKCGEKKSSLIDIFSPSIDYQPEPDKMVEQRLIKTYRNISGKDKIIPIFSLNKKIARPVLAAAAIIAAIGISIFFSLDILTHRDKLPIYVYYFKGTPTIDNEPVAYHMPIKDRSKIHVEKGEVLVLAYKNRFIVKIHELSELKLKKLKQKSATGDHQFVFDLRKGTLFTRYNQNSHDTKYFYFTPNASLAATKSSFIMKVAGNRTIVIPKEGSIDIKSLENQESVAAAPMKEYVITSSIEAGESTGESTGKDLRIELDRPFSDEEIISLHEILDSMS